MESYFVNRYENELINSAPDGTYIAHVNHDQDYINFVAKVAKQVILVKSGNGLSEPLSQYNFRGHIYCIDGPIERLKFE